jgi:acyl-CoA reductase-like NAD-dependent aldehyde dehydrogenase
MNEYVMNFKGSILVRADSEDEAEQLFNDAHYGLATVFDNTDEMEVYSFQYDPRSMREV